jgi:hypothetical protein
MRVIVTTTDNKQVDLSNIMNIKAITISNGDRLPRNDIGKKRVKKTKSATKSSE